MVISQDFHSRLLFLFGATNHTVARNTVIEIYKTGTLVLANPINGGIANTVSVAIELCDNDADPAPFSSDAFEDNTSASDQVCGVGVALLLPPLLKFLFIPVVAWQALTSHVS